MPASTRAPRRDPASQLHRQPSSMPLLPQLASTLAALGGGLLAIATIAGFCLHLAGHVAHTAYLSNLGVEPDLYPQGADWKVINGYYAVVLQGFGVLKDFPWGHIFLVFIGAAFLIFVIRLPNESGATLRWLDGRSRLFRESILAMTGSLSAIAMFISASSFVLLIAIVPGLAGELWGKERAQKLHASLLRGDVKDSSELWRNGRLEQSGFVVAISKDLISIYDPKSKIIRTIDRTRTELRQPLSQEVSPLN